MIYNNIQKLSILSLIPWGQWYLITILNSLIEMGGDDVPLPKAFVPNTVTVILSERGQCDKDSSKTLWQTPLLQEEAGIVSDSQSMPDVASA